MPTDLPQVLILGTYHMANPNQDSIKTEFDDVLSAPRQRQIEELVRRVSSFQPTHVAIEREPARMPAVLGRYGHYLADRCALERHEWEQIGFRLARLMGHQRLYGIDYEQPLDFERAIAYAGDHGMTALIEEVQAILNELTERTRELEAQGKLLELFEHLNTAATDELDHSLYIRMAPLGAGDQYIGANLLADWYARNLKIFANIAGLAARQSSRIFVLVGAAHRRLLSQFVLESPNLKLVDPLPYLQGLA
jgi:hypothetical protein